MGKNSEIKRLAIDFERPPKEYTPAPFFFINFDMDPEIVGDALEELVKKGVMGAVLHPRTGLTIEFGTVEFWERLKTIVRRAKELGMVIWLYDDYNWPSGTAAGRVIKERPDFCGMGLHFRYGKEVREGENILGAFVKDGNRYRRQEDGHGDKRCLIVSVERMTDTNYALSSAPWFEENGRGVLDIMNPDATNRFIEIVYCEFEKHLKEFFGDPIVGVFTDEPQNYRPFPWTKKFPQAFRERFGYDIVENLPSLIDDVGDYARVRCDYYALIRDLGRDSFYKNLRKWVDSHGLSLTGHLGEEDFIERLPHTHGSPFTPLLEMHIPGTDYLGPGHGYMKKQPLSGHPNFNPKLASSVSIASGARRTLCEIWGGAGWGYGPKVLKQSLDWASALGLNLFVPHAVHVSLMGMRKRDYPPSHFVQQPYWEDYGLFADYISRLSLMMSIGEPCVDILVLFPTTSLWAETRGMGVVSKKGGGVVKSVREIVDRLLRNQRDFDYLFEDLIPSGRVKVSRGKIKIGRGNYKTLVIPRMAYIPDFVSSFIKEVKDAGIEVFSLDSHLDKEISPYDGVKSFKDESGLVEYITEMTASEIIITGRDSKNFACRHIDYYGTDIYFISHLGERPFSGELCLKGKGTPQIWELESGKRYRPEGFREVGGGHLSRVNFAPGESRLYLIGREGADSPLSLDDSKDEYPHPTEVRQKEISLKGDWETKRVSDNLFRLDRWRLIHSSKSHAFPNLSKLWRDTRYSIPAKIKISIIRGVIEVFRPLICIRKSVKYRPFVNMEVDSRLIMLVGRLLSIPVKSTGIYQRADLAKDATMYMGGIPMIYSMPPEGADYEIESSFYIDHIPEKIYLIWEDLGEPLKVFLNDIPISDNAVPFFLWDRSNRRVEISSGIVKGKNRVRIISRQPDFPTIPPNVHGIEPVVIAGDFDVSGGRLKRQGKSSKGLTWGGKNDGNYSGTIIFSRRFTVSETSRKKRAILTLEDVRETARVRINGNDIGVRLWPPYDFELTGHLKDGENLLEVMVSNTPENLLGSPIPSGIMGDVKLLFYNP